MMKYPLKNSRVYNEVTGKGAIMQQIRYARQFLLSVIILGCAASALAQTQMPVVTNPVLLIVVDENGVAVSSAQVTVQMSGQAEIHQTTDYAGHTSYTLQEMVPYRLSIQKPGFYESVVEKADPQIRELQVVLNHEQMVHEQVSVTDSVPGIDVERTSDKVTMNMPEVINIPYPTSRDIRNLLPFFPGVVQDATGQVHVAGSETWSTLDTLDGFDVRSPVSGILAMRVSADAVRSIDQETTRYPVEFGRSTGGVVAFYTGMGDNKFRFNATNFLPSFQNKNGIRFDNFVPRFTFSGPLVRDRAWFFDGAEVEYDNIYIQELPAGADSDHLLRGSNLIKFQMNVAQTNTLSGGLLVNEYHSPYDGISSLVPQMSTTKRDTIAWLPYMRDQQSFHSGALLDVGVGLVRFRDGYAPHGESPFLITPELFRGSYFENLTGHSQRIEGNAALYLPPHKWKGRHDLKAGIDVDHLEFSDSITRAPVSYLSESGALLRQSVFPAIEPYTRHNLEVGAYLQDRWTPRTGVLIVPGLRFDWDEIARRPLLAPRLAATYSPAGSKDATKISAGVGLYYEHTQLEYLERALAGIRYDTYYATDGATPLGNPLETTFSANYGSLHESRALNWSAGVEQKLPGSVYLQASYVRKIVSNEFAYVDQSGASAISGNYALTNSREDHDYLAEIDARHTFSGGYTIFAAYTHSSARTNAAIDYVPTLSMLGVQQRGPLPWDTPDRVISWGWLPFLAPGFKKRWDFVYTFDWHSGFPYTSVNDLYQVIGSAGSRRFPDYVSLSPGLEVRFHFRKSYFGLRGVMENATSSSDPLVVNNVVNSPQYGSFSEFQGRAFTARLRLIGSK
jgi:hypothetical protein